MAAAMISWVSFGGIMDFRRMISVRVGFTARSGYIKMVDAVP